MKPRACALLVLVRRGAPGARRVVQRGCCGGLSESAGSDGVRDGESLNANAAFAARQVAFSPVVACTAEPAATQNVFAVFAVIAPRWPGLGNGTASS